MGDRQDGFIGSASVPIGPARPENRAKCRIVAADRCMMHPHPERRSRTGKRNFLCASRLPPRSIFGAVHATGGWFGIPARESPTPMSFESPSSISAVATTPRTAIRSLSWGAILAGCIAALSVHLLATLLGLGLGLSMADPLRGSRPGEEFTIGVGIAWSVSALLALWVGGWVAGRGARTTNANLGGLHGFLVWSTATVVTALLITSGTSALIGGAAKLAGKTAAVAGKGLATAGNQAADALEQDGAPDMLAQFAGQNSNFIGSFVEDLSASPPHPLTATNRREIGWALFRIFDQAKDARSPEVKDAAIQTITQGTGIPEPEVRRRLDELIASYDRAQEDLKTMRDRALQKARDAAHRSERVIAHSALWTVVAFLVGAASAYFGGKRGARRAWHEAYPETPDVVPPLT
jgi:hypothetical protein